MTVSYGAPSATSLPIGVQKSRGATTSFSLGTMSAFASTFASMSSVMLGLSVMTTQPAATSPTNSDSPNSPVPDANSSTLLPSKQSLWSDGRNDAMAIEPLQTSSARVLYEELGGCADPQAVGEAPDAEAPSRDAEAALRHTPPLLSWPSGGP
eukprot:CAMPEP_0114139956 /NCGR_PEP_ID=MMETSP0043_2-20121206/17129_1 /TAXON_ID=464988 /ORGANISM="Hemiselmis andersenii, Strain CCMP644" /LENGTH=152 /DNA_ID=CAMNT_0001234021 /DNA_START=288 /DNA_END=742 /DNA_ORIENTATION=+